MAIAMQTLNAPSALIATKSLLIALDEVGLDVSRWQDTRMKLLGSVERKAALKTAQGKSHR
jgi:hypothetical protein